MSDQPQKKFVGRILAYCGRLRCFTVGQAFLPVLLLMTRQLKSVERKKKIAAFKFEVQPGTIIVDTQCGTASGSDRMLAFNVENSSNALFHR